MRVYTSLAVLLFGTLALSVPEGYLVAPVLLALGCVALPFATSLRGPKRGTAALALALLFYALVFAIEVWWSGQSLRRLAIPAIFLLALPCLTLLRLYPPRAAWVWSGMALGAGTAGLLAAWQVWGLGMSRARGFTNAILFGDLSLLLGAFCLAGLGWTFTRRSRRHWQVLLVVGALLGALGSFLSGSRGGWVSLPLLLLVLYGGYGRHLSRRSLLGTSAFVLVGAAIVYAIPALGVHDRIQRIATSYADFEQGDPTNSVGARLEMWRGAGLLIAERPLTGWNDAGYERGRDRLIAEGAIHPYIGKFDHPHNDFLEVWVKRGLPGLLTLLALYLLPLTLFFRHLQSRNLKRRAYAVAGMMLPMAFMGFGLSYTLLIFNNTALMYVFWLLILWSGLESCETHRDNVDEELP